jgi:hypothetical protein
LKRGPSGPLFSRSGAGTEGWVRCVDARAQTRPLIAPRGRGGPTGRGAGAVAWQAGPGSAARAPAGGGRRATRKGSRRRRPPAGGGIGPKDGRGGDRATRCVRRRLTAAAPLRIR